MGYINIKKHAQQKIVLILFAIISVMYVRYTWKSTENEKFEQAKQIARSIVASLPMEDIKGLKAYPQDVKLPQYQVIKSTLEAIVKINTKVKFAYIYTERNGRIYFMADSEPEGSKEYSPPGQEYTEAKPTDIQQFKDGNEQITVFITDRWGTWTSVLIPIKDKISHETIAVFGMDFNVTSWISSLVYEVAESSVLILLLLLVLLFIFRIKAKNNLLNIQISKGKLSEHTIRESESRFRAIFDQAPIAIALLDLNGRPIVSNSSMLKMVGYSEDELSKMNFTDITYSLDFDVDYIQYADLLEGVITGYKVEKRFVHKTGILVWVKLIVTLLRDENGIAKEVMAMAEDITENRKSEDALEEIGLKYRTFFENSMDAILLTTSDGRTLSVNRAACEMFGYSEDELISLGRVGIEDGTDSRLSALLSKRKLHGRARGEVTFIRHDGTRFAAEVSSSIFKNQEGVEHASMIIRDITKRKSAEKEISMLAQSLKSVNEYISITDLDDKILFVNDTFLKAYGYGSEELIGKQISTVQAHYNVQNRANGILSSSLGFEWQGEVLNKRKDGNEFPVFLSTSIIKDTNDRPIGFISAATDITKRKQTEKELIEAKNKAEESDRLKSAFLANMSHEIRTPMNGIIGFAKLLKEPDLSGEEQREFLNYIEKSGDRMLNIINDIVNISKVESGQMEVSLLGTNINDQIDFIYAFFKTEAQQKGIKLFFKKSLPSKQVNIKTDREKIYAILINLVKNALKFTPTGTIEFGYNIKSDTQPKHLEFFVKDTGIGIDEKQTEFIFERFRQGSESLNRNYEGAGLGLSISKAYVEMLGGRIWVESLIGKGSDFYFTLPYICEEEEMTEAKEEGIKREEVNQLKDLKILIVENDPVSEILITLEIKTISREILIARTGNEAVDICRNNPDVSLILMDIAMPQMDGYEATRQIRLFNSGVVIIAQTAFALTGDREIALAAGCNDYISKPYGKSLLISLLKNHF